MVIDFDCKVTDSSSQACDKNDGVIRFFPRSKVNFITRHAIIVIILKAITYLVEKIHFRQWCSLQSWSEIILKHYNDFDCYKLLNSELINEFYTSYG